VHKKNGKIVSFTSYTGGLPAPEANDNPFGYKLSWSPRGVLLAGRNDAHFLKDGKKVLIPGKDLFDNYKKMQVPGIGEFEGYPNRDSLSYIDIYNIHETKTMIRGTFRNLGWCSTMKKIADLGLFDLEERNLTNTSYAKILKFLTSAIDDNVAANVARYLNLQEEDPIIARLSWLGLFSDELIPNGISTYLDAICHLFEQKMQYTPGERDMIVMYHDFTVDYPDSRERITSTLIDYGIPNGDSSMSRTVALPVAIASRLILEGKINLTGVHRPILPEIYNPILKELESLDISLEEQKSVL
ncbi:MAG: saccharopine dehydrogenase C-terminal domain-containing protein, partial [Candidatus Thorarchaeota archaeon]